jgi:hypothetical protein
LAASWSSAGELPPQCIFVEFLDMANNSAACCRLGEEFFVEGCWNKGDDQDEEEEDDPFFIIEVNRLLGCCCNALDAMGHSCLKKVVQYSFSKSFLFSSREVISSRVAAINKILLSPPPLLPCDDDDDDDGDRLSKKLCLSNNNFSILSNSSQNC